MVEDVGIQAFYAGIKTAEGAPVLLLVLLLAPVLHLPHQLGQDLALGIDDGCDVGEPCFTRTTLYPRKTLLFSWLTSLTRRQEHLSLPPLVRDMFIFYPSNTYFFPIKILYKIFQSSFWSNSNIMTDISKVSKLYYALVFSMGTDGTPLACGPY